MWTGRAWGKPTAWPGRCCTKATCASCGPCWPRTGIRASANGAGGPISWRAGSAGKCWSWWDGPLPAQPQPPHLEDVWVHGLRWRRGPAPAEQRQHILELTRGNAGAPLFGAPLIPTRSGAYLQPGTGKRSLATIRVVAEQITFGGSWREGAGAPDLRVQLPVPDLGRRWLSVKDHHLLVRAEGAGQDVDRQIAALNASVQAMGPEVAVRLGLSRAFGPEEGAPGSPQCWLMADGFFSWSNPQS